MTLVPVSQKIDENFNCELLPISAAHQQSDIEILPNEDDDGPDYFEDKINLAAIAIEQLALALDPYPRTEDAKPSVTEFAGPGIQPLRDADLKPFAKLASLKEKLSDQGS